MGPKAFDRRGREIHVRDEAKQLADAVRPLLQEMRDLASRIHEIRDKSDQTIKMLCNPFHLAHFLGTVLREFEQKHPQITVELNVMSPNSGPYLNESVRKRLLREGSVDFLVANSSRRVSAYIPLWRTRLICIVADGHPFRHRRSVTINDLVGQRVTALTEHWWSRIQLDRLIRESGCEVEVDTEPLADVAVGMARAGIGVAVMADDTMPSLGPNHPRLVESGRSFFTEVSLHWMPERVSTPMEHFLSHVRGYAIDLTSEDDGQCDEALGPQPDLASTND